VGSVKLITAVVQPGKPGRVGRLIWCVACGLTVTEARRFGAAR